MIAPRTKGRIYLQSLLDAVITLSLFWAYLFGFAALTPGGWKDYFIFLDRYFVYGLLAFGVIILHGARSMYQNPRWWAPSLKESHLLSLNQTFNVAVGLSLFLVATKDKGISRLFLFSWLPVLYATLLVANRYLPARLVRGLFKDRQERTIFIGSPDSARVLSDWMEYQKTVGIEFIEFKADFSINNLGRLDQSIRQHQATQVILTEIPDVKYNLHHIIDVCERAGVRLLVFSNFERLFRHKVSFNEDAGLQFIGLRDEPLESPHNRATKRILDVLVALPMVMLVLPLVTMLVWLLQRFQSPGPVFYQQLRAGFKGRPFQIWKFRTMHPRHGEDSTQAAHGDARIFPAGRWLRRSSIDELPQFINVLKGEMSLVGPRPHLIQHNEQFARIMRSYYIRAMVKPGITGLAQVRGFRGQASTDQDIIRRVESDISYLETWSLSLDLVILARTFRQMIRPPRTAV